MAKKTPLVALGFIVLTLVAAKSLLPNYVTSPRQARERVLRQDLRTMNAVITQYTLDNQLPPHSLDDLVVAGYLKEVPNDPMTGGSECNRRFLPQSRMSDCLFPYALLASRLQDSLAGDTVRAVAPLSQSASKLLTSSR